MENKIEKFKEQLRAEYVFYIYKCWTRDADSYMRAMIDSDKAVKRFLTIKQSPESRTGILKRKTREYKEAEKEQDDKLHEAVKAYVEYNRSAGMMATALSSKSITMPYLRSADAEFYDSPLVYQQLVDEAEHKRATLETAPAMAGEWLTCQMYILCSLYRNFYRKARDRRGRGADKSTYHGTYVDKALTRFDMINGFIKSLIGEASSSEYIDAYVGRWDAEQIRVDYLSRVFDGSNDAPDIVEFLNSAKTVLDKMQTVYQGGREDDALEAGIDFLHSWYIPTDGGSYNLSSVDDKDWLKSLCKNPSREYDGTRPEPEMNDGDILKYEDGLYCMNYNDTLASALSGKLCLSEADYTEFGDHGIDRLNALVTPGMPDTDAYMRGEPINMANDELLTAMQQAVKEAEQKAERAADAEMLARRRKITDDVPDYEFRQWVSDGKELHSTVPHLYRYPVLGKE